MDAASRSTSSAPRPSSTRFRSSARRTEVSSEDGSRRSTDLRGSRTIYFGESTSIDLQPCSLLSPEKLICRPLPFHSSTPPRTLLRLSTTIIAQSIMASQRQIIDLETLTNGISYFFQPLLSWCLVGILDFLSREVRRLGFVLRSISSCAFPRPFLSHLTDTLGSLAASTPPPTSKPSSSSSSVPPAPERSSPSQAATFSACSRPRVGSTWCSGKGEASWVRRSKRGFWKPEVRGGFSSRLVSVPRSDASFGL